MAEVVKPAWLPEGLYQQWLTAYTEAGGESTPGSANYATEFIRQTPEYDSYFPGLRREDGSLRYENNPERTYYDNINSYKNTVEGLGMNPDIFGEDYISLIEGDTSPSEFSSRADAMYARVLSTGNDIRDWYGANYGLDMTNEGILASLMSERVSNAVLDKQITMAEIGGEAAMRDFDITTGFVNMLEEQGMDRGDAQRLFGTAETLLPALNRLAGRHGDVDDDFDIMEFADAEGYQVGDDSNQAQRLKRLQAQEKSTFTGSAATDIARGAMGGMTGLVDV